jgi:hypothetical protein
VAGWLLDQMEAVRGALAATRVACAEGYGASPVYGAIERICERQASGLERELVRA